MAITLFRLGLWILLAVLATWVLRDNVLSDAAQFLNAQLLNRAGLLGIGTIALSVVALVFEKLTSGPVKRKCKTCGKPTIAGEFYCRPHLRDIMDRVRGDLR